jgi:hypothetical protein
MVPVISLLGTKKRRFFDADEWNYPWYLVGHQKEREDSVMGGRKNSPFIHRERKSPFSRENARTILPLQRPLYI